MRQPRQIRGDSAVRIEAISAPVERQHRVEVNDLGRQIRDFRVGYIRRVRDDQIESPAQSVCPVPSNHSGSLRKPAMSQILPRQSAGSGRNIHAKAKSVRTRVE